jgi:hypothetical protein
MFRLAAARRESYGNNSFGSARPSGGGSIAHLALQQQLGILPEWWFGIDSFDRLGACAYWPCVGFSESGKVNVLFNSMPVAFKPESVVIEVNGGTGNSERLRLGFRGRHPPERFS